MDVCNALNEGGRLILTLPVDRQFWEEYRDGQDPCGTQEKQENNQFFFQRFYDLDSIQQRLLDPIQALPLEMRWFGESNPGRFHEYIQRWLREGIERTVKDPREIADHYQEFNSWGKMPGIGICGIAIQK